MLEDLTHALEQVAPVVFLKGEEFILPLRCECSSAVAYRQRGEEKTHGVEILQVIRARDEHISETETIGFSKANCRACETYAEMNGSANSFQGLKFSCPV